MRVGLTLPARIGEIALPRVVAALPMVEPSYKSAPRIAGAMRLAAQAAAVARSPIDGAMDRCADGDDAGFDELYRLAAPRVQGFLLKLCGNAALADDLTQDAFLRVYLA